LKSGGNSPQAFETLGLSPKRLREDGILMVKLEASAGQAIKEFLAAKGFQRPLRIDLQSSGCCDPSLCLSLDDIRDSDLVQEMEGLTFVISPAIRELVGDVTISHKDENGTEGFVLTSSKPVSEWDGFGVTIIRT